MQLSPPTRRLLDVISMAFAWGSASLITLVAGWLIWETLSQGLPELSWSLLWEPPLNAGREGGISSILFSTFCLLLICMLTSIPMGLGTAILLAEAPRNRLWTRWVRRSLDVLAAVPSIVFGLFGNAFFCHALGMGYSLLAGGLTLSCMVLPLLIRITEEGIRAVPVEYRLGAASLGLSRSTTLFRILIPSAFPSLAAGWILGVGRALAETAALIFTSGYVTRMPESWFDSGRALSVHVYDLAMNVTGGNPRAYATASVLILILLLLNGVVAAITRWAAGRPRGAPRL